MSSVRAVCWKFGKWTCVSPHAEASDTEQLPRVSEKDGECGQQVAACADPYPCCSVSGRCGCTGQHCGIGCQSLYGTCAKEISTTQTPLTDAPVTNAPVASPDTSCSNAWVVSAIAANNELRALAGEQALVCDEAASQLAASWSETMCQYASCTLPVLSSW